MQLSKQVFFRSVSILFISFAGLEILSFLAFLSPVAERAIFILILALVLFFSLLDLRHGVWAILAELFIGSQGYLFYFDAGTIKISLRIGLWLIVISIWLARYLYSLMRKNSSWLSIFLRREIFSIGGFPFFLILFIFIFLGALIGYAHHHDFANLFFDLNGWLFFLLLFPFYEVFFNPRKPTIQPFSAIGKIFLAATAWLGFKTFLLFYFFSHSFPATFLNDNLYRWLRTTLTGEITLTAAGFVRIFSQSQIYLLFALAIGLFGVSYFWATIKKNKRVLLILTLAGSLFCGAILISFSRSFWVGALVIFLAYIFWAIRRRETKIFLAVTILFITTILLGAVLVAGVAKFPVPRPSSSFTLSAALASRADALNGEAAVSSRSALLLPLWKKIASSPILGSGFGATVTYRTSDPRILAQNSSGTYTTYAFEWGWLDIWLKLGFGGLLAYLLLLGSIINRGYLKDDWLGAGLSTSLIALAAVSVFSPYTNHPLGIGFILLAAAIIFQQSNTPCAYS
ncbi:MAG TPA: O-antigen ligase family protein [Candidatus Methylomirabilis sp.]|nr:O-antigen ligase family protein [Candidatus Methylomirabilis sp.]